MALHAPAMAQQGAASGKTEVAKDRCDRDEKASPCGKYFCKEKVGFGSLGLAGGGASSESPLKEPKILEAATRASAACDQNQADCQCATALWKEYGAFDRYYRVLQMRASASDKAAKKELAEFETRTARDGPAMKACESGGKASGSPCAEVAAAWEAKDVQTAIKFAEKGCSADDAPSCAIAGRILLQEARKKSSKELTQRASSALSRGCDGGDEVACLRYVVGTEKGEMKSKGSTKKANRVARITCASKHRTADILEMCAELPEARSSQAGSTKHRGIARASAGGATVTGSLDKKIVDRVIKQHRREATYCYETGLHKDKDLKGKIVVKLIISATGSVVSSSIAESTLNNTTVEKCMAGKVRRWVFPEPKGGGIVIVNAPFDFE
jgi:hypothetical protein